MGSDTETVMPDPGRGAGESCGRTAAAQNTDKSVAVERTTPLRIIARLTQDPGPAPVGFTAMTGDDVTLGLLNSGDALGIDGRWCPVQGCTQVDDWVTVDTAFGYPTVEAFNNVPVHLARVIDIQRVPS